MKQKLVIIIGAFVIIAIGLVALFLFRQSGSGAGSAGTGGTTTGLPPVVTSTPVGPAPTGTKLTLGTADGDVAVNNFYNDPAFITQDQQTVAIAQTSTYSIVYNVADSSFIISLLSTPLADARQAAEAAFLSSLGISQTDACKLKVSEGVPISVSDEYPGENFPLSFCGSSPPLE